MKRTLSAILLYSLLTACSSVIIVPQPQPGSHIDKDGERIVQAGKGVQLAVKVHETSVRPSPTGQNFSSFWVEVTNQRNVLLPLSFKDFILIDDQGRQYQPADPAELVETLTDTASYLIPYPYVGYYYLQDSVRGQSDTQFRTEGSYYSSRRPEYIESESLPVTDVHPSATVAGAIYFPAELRTMEGFRLEYQTGVLPGQKSFQMSLPFTVRKK